MQLGSSLDHGRSYAQLCSFTQTLKKPKWLVRFPLTIESPKRHRPTRSVTSSNSIRTKTVIASKAPLREKSEEVLTKLELDCAATLLEGSFKLKQEKKALTQVKRRLQSCQRHTKLLVYSNQRAPYFILLHRLAQQRKH